MLPLDDCLYALQPTIPHLTRSSLHRGLQRHGVSRLPQVEGDRRRPLQGPHRPHRQRNPLRHPRQYELGGAGHQGRPRRWGASLGARLRIRLRPERDRSSADKAQAPVDQRASRKMNRTIKDATVKRDFHETHDQLRTHPRDFVDAYNFARRPKDPQRPHPIRIRLQSLDFKASEIQPQSAPENAGTKQVGYGGGARRLAVAVGRRQLPAHLAT